MRRFAMYLLVLTLLLTACGASGQPEANGEMDALIKRVVDGDTFELDSGEKVRMIGVDTPETVKPNHPVEPYGKEASNYSKELLTGKKVKLKFDVEPYDKYKRLLAYVYLEDGTFVNEKLVRDGYARIMTIPPNVAQAELFLAAEREAREQNRGLWALEGKQAEAPKEKAKPKKQSNNNTVADTAPPEGKTIKGNINSKGEKIYHVPGSASYEQTNAETWFATEAEAQQAGFRAPKR
ncbi:thermonuclease family protein [Brevibacillus sp. HB2.2]|uniref:thermonuclease family protein n=1 Tax=Brevibacillus sp. HB2.2 TaxID=2738846 RepID=UPI00156B0232|nr:thermonuclease family protein [Brevibacillus sp. HB2.2]NRS47354.1 thermonuclease family protein [Brevibacillus sp. HB2.2]